MSGSHKVNVDAPVAKIRRQSVFSMVWLVPLIAGIVAAVLVYQNVRQLGPVITIQFEDANGIDANQSVIRYRGVRVGSVKSIALSRDTKFVEIRARLDRSAANLAREGTVFWIVRPEVGAAGVHALETIVSGPFIQAFPASPDAKVQKHFIGATEAPAVSQPANGVEFVLNTPQVRSLGPGSPVYYRGLQAGKVRFLELSDDATTVKVHVLVKKNFAPLVRLNSIWWNAGGINIDWHFLVRFNMTAENLRSVITGGIAFATPNEPSDIAPSGTFYALYDRPEDKWLEWAPHLTITNAAVANPGNPSIDLNSVGQSQK